MDRLLPTDQTVKVSSSDNGIIFYAHQLAPLSLQVRTASNDIDVLPLTVPFFSFYRLP